jgi:hypothetical protein
VRFELTKGVRPDEEPGRALPIDAQWIYALEDDVERVEMSIEELKEGFDFLEFSVLPENPEEGG